MGDYLIVGRDPGSASEPSARLRHAAIEAGMRVKDLTPLTWLASAGPHPPRPTVVGAWTLVGDVLNREKAVLPSTATDDPWSFERKLVARFWGRFVGVRTSGAGQITAILRDPSGALDCVAWSQDGLTIVATTLPDWLIRALRPPWRIDPVRVSDSLRDPLAASSALLLAGPVGVAPGFLQPVPLDQPAEPLWRPQAIIERGAGLRPAEAAGLLRSSVDEAVGGLARLTDGLAAEVSGGLDSSLVAASLIRKGGGGVGLWLHAYGTTPESDERRHAAALGERLGIAPTAVPLARGALTEALLERISNGPRPGLNALDVHHDLDWARRVTAAGLGAVITGKGGDSVLLQGATGDVFTDLWLARGPRALRDPLLPALARRNEVSVWSMIQSARRHDSSAPPRLLREGPLLPPVSGPPPPHPWMEDVAAYGPAKALQLAGVIDNITRHQPSLQTEAIDVLHPLCAQPVVEACLAIPTPILALGARDRGLARHAFADRLPEAILGRRTKGDLTRLYGRMILDSLAFLRPWLIEGRLVQLGLLDRAGVEALLTEESLMWRGFYADIMAAAAHEGWVRAWERRLA